jgi:hypothetical protein
LNLCLDPALNLALGDPVQHGGIRRRRFRPEITVFRRKITEILGNRLHRAKGIVKPLKGAGEGPV